jgi:hypothetical protein
MKILDTFQLKQRILVMVFVFFGIFKIFISKSGDSILHPLVSKLKAPIVKVNANLLFFDGLALEIPQNVAKISEI